MHADDAPDALALRQCAARPGSRDPGALRALLRLAPQQQLAQNGAPVEGEPHDEHGAAIGCVSCPVLGSNFTSFTFMLHFNTSQVWSKTSNV